MIPPGRCPLLRLAPLVVACLLASRLDAQLLSTVIENARIVTMRGSTIARGTIIIKGDRISAIGVNPDVPFLSRRIDAQGGTVTPGLIDIYSSLGMTSGATRTGKPTARAEDAFDRYATEHLQEALRNGVTTVYISSRGAVGIHGTGSVMRLVPGTDGSMGEALTSGSVLEIDAGSGRSPLARIATYDSVRKRFNDALKYRRDREIYEEDLEEYEKKLEERASKNKKADESKDGQRKETGKENKTASENGKRGPGSKPSPGTSDGKKSDSKDDLKKPAEPARDRSKEILLRALDRELQVRVEAHRSEDILNALDLKKEFSLDLVLVGATDAYLVADEIARAEVSVVLGDQLGTELYTDGPFRRRSAVAGATLNRAGVSWWVGSGARSASATRFVLSNALVAVAASGIENPAAHALALVTSRAAALLGVADQIGRLAPTLKADLVVWSGDPLDPATTVRKVFVDGRLAYDAEVSP